MIFGKRSSGPRAKQWNPSTDFPHLQCQRVYIPSYLSKETRRKIRTEYRLKVLYTSRRTSCFQFFENMPIRSVETSLVADMGSKVNDRFVGV